jgi:hypothetical protein
MRPVYTPMYLQLFQMVRSLVWKAYQVLREGLEVSKDEIQELIRYFESTEDYGICDKLNRLKNER